MDVLIKMVTDRDNNSRGRVILLILSGLLTAAGLVVLLMGNGVSDLSPDAPTVEDAFVQPSGQDEASTDTVPQSRDGSLQGGTLYRIARIVFAVSAILAILSTLWTWFDLRLSIDNLMENPLWVFSFAAVVLSAIVIAVLTLLSDHSFPLFGAAFPKEIDYAFEENAAVAYIEYEEYPPTTLTLTDANKVVANNGAINIVAHY